MVHSSLAESPTAQDITAMPPAPTPTTKDIPKTPTPTSSPSQQTEQQASGKPLPLTPYQVLSPFKTASGKTN